MLFGRSVNVVEDRQGRKLLLVKESNTFYLLENNQVKYVTFLKNNILNAASVGALIGYFFKLEYIYWAIIALGFYILYLVVFNTKIFPKLPKVKEKNIKVNPPTESKNQLTILSVGFLAVGVGLLLCIPLGQVDETMNSGVVAACGLFSIVMGVRHWISSRK